MDGDRPVVDGRDLLESGLQELVREVFEEGWEFGSDGLPNTECGYAESEEAHARHDKKLHELLISYFDGETSDVGAQDEASEAREVGDSVRQKGYIERAFEDGPVEVKTSEDGKATFRIVRPKSHLIPRDPNAFVVDEWDPIKKITDEFAREMELRFAYEGKRVAIGHCDLTRDPDGSIHARIEYYPQDKKSDDEDTDEYGWIREEDVPEGWKKSPHAVFSDFIRQYSGPQNPR